MFKVIDRLANKGWLELTGFITGMGLATSGALLDAARSSSYDPALCAISGNSYCDGPLLPPAIDSALVGFGAFLLLLVFIAMGLKLWRASRIQTQERSPKS
jgi:hypothetical protein